MYCNTVVLAKQLTPTESNRNANKKTIRLLSLEGDLCRLLPHNMFQVCFTLSQKTLKLSIVRSNTPYEYIQYIHTLISIQCIQYG